MNLLNQTILSLNPITPFILFYLICLIRSGHGSIHFVGEHEGGQGRHSGSPHVAGEGTSSGGGQGSGHPFSIDPSEPKQYKVEIYLKRFDGGTVLLLKKLPGHYLYSTRNIEKVVGELGIANVKYSPSMDEDFTKSVYGNIQFLKRSEVLNVNEGEEMSTLELVEKIAESEMEGKNKGTPSCLPLFGCGYKPKAKWMLPGSKVKNPTYEPLFDGHLIAVLRELVNGHYLERFRIHFTMERLNIFDTVNRKNYFVIPNNRELVIIPEENVWHKGDSVRGARWRDDKFYSEQGEIEVFTRPLTLFQILNIAYYKVIAGRTSEDSIPFKCRHFVYEFVTAIAAEQFKAGLLEFENWPENIRSMDNQIAQSNGDTTAFEKSSEKLEELQNFNDYENDDYTKAITIIPPNPLKKH
ncbi:unnamed protein product [Meloidogyne enterolobii]|uniref:Uncharacterized protein n=1 Tax=Meloidogyne enterolobii TaxID=390850 RepID=A0ACB0ZFM6_MELEN